MRKLIPILLLICGVTNAQVNLYVSPSGNDSNPGTSLGAPKKTIGSAAAKLAELSLDKTLTDGVTELTLAAWVHPDSKGDWDGIVSSTGSFFALQFSNGTGNPLHFRANNAGLNAPANSVPTGQWSHVAGVWKSGMIQKLYLNGVQVANNASPPTGTIAIDDWFLGSDRLISGRYLDGQTRDVHIWTQALTPSQVADLAADPPTVHPGAVMSEVSETDFNGSSYNFLNDTGLPNGAIVNIRAGTYRESVTVPVSGSAGGPVIFRPYNNEQVILSAGDPVSGWTVHSGNIWKATVPWDIGTDGDGNTLFVGGVLKMEAREGTKGTERDPMRLASWGEIDSGDLSLTGFTSNDAKGWGNDFWNGAKVRHHTHDWIVTDSVVADYVSSTGQVVFATPFSVVSQKHDIGYYFFDTLKAVNEAGEWYKDRITDTLYYQAEPAQDPNTLDIEFKNRTYAFDVGGREHIHIEDLVFRGLSIDTDGGTSHNRFSGNTFYAYNKGGDGNFYINGDHNVLRDNEISHTWGWAVTASGLRQEIVNNHFHDIGFYGTSRVVSMSGDEHLVSHNTVNKFARSFLDGYPNRSEFKYNLFEDGSNLSWDTGVFDGDSGRGNGGGCIVHHNIFRDTNSIGIFCSFYAGLDLVIHHNLVYNLTPTTMRGGQLIFAKYYHNTLIGPRPDGDTNAASYAYESSYSNNIQISTEDMASLGVEVRGNHNYVAGDFANFAGNDFRLASGSDAIDAGIVLPGINDGYSGAAPDSGALEFGESLWDFGHDFVTPPNPVYTWQAFPGTNIYGNGQFRDNDSDEWTPTGSPVFFNANTWNTVSTGLSYIGGYAYQLEPGDGIARTFTGLKPDTWYTVASETRLVDQRIEAEQYDGSFGSPASGSHRGENYMTDLDDGDWLSYNGIDFGASGKYDTIELSYTRPPGSPKTTPDASLELRLGSSGGTLLGTFTFHEAAIDSWRATQISIPPTSGSQTVFLVAKGTEADVMRFAAVRFLHSNYRPDDKLTVGIRNHGAPPVTTRNGFSYWLGNYEEFTFKTGPAATSAELFAQNDGIYDAYLDSLALFEKVPFTSDAAGTGIPIQSSTLGGNIASRAINGTYGDDSATTEDLSNSWWQVDLGEPKDIHAIKLTATVTNFGQLSNFRVSVWNSDPRNGGNPFWKRDYFGGTLPGSGETFIVKGTDFSLDGETALRDIDGRYVRVELLGNNGLGNGTLGLAELEVLTHDGNDLVESDGILRSGTGFWEVLFPQLTDYGEIKLVNVSDPATFGELSNFKVSVWNTEPGLGGVKLWEKNYFTTGSVGQGDAFVIGGDEIADDGTTRLSSCHGRMVRVELNGLNNNGTNVFQLDDFIIRRAADAPSSNNLALAGTASQSSNHYADWGFAEDAVNSVVLPEGDFTTTQNSSQPWWQVDLGQTPVIDQIVIFNRIDAADRLGTFRVSVWNNDPNTGGTELWGKNYSYNGSLTPGLTYTSAIPAGGALAINGSVTSGGTRLDQVVGGRFVRVRLLGSNLLSLAEVQVWTDDTELRIPASTTSLNLDLGTRSSPLQSGFTRVSPETHGDVWWDCDVTAINRGSGPSDSERDFVRHNGPANLSLQIQNGTWDVTLQMGDKDLARDDMMVHAEGSLVSNDIDSPVGQYSYVDSAGSSASPTNFTTIVRDGVLSLSFDDMDGGDPDWVVNRISLTRTGNVPATFNHVVDLARTSFDYDFGTTTSPVAPGYGFITPASGGDITWSAAVAAIDRGSASGDLLRDFVHSPSTTVLEHPLTAGTWEVTLDMGDAAQARDLMTVKAEGVVLQSDISGGAGSFPRIVATVPVSDGSLSLEFSDTGGDPDWVVNRLSLARTGTGIPPDAPTSLLASQLNWDGATLNWTDNATNEDDFRIERSIDSGPWLVLTDVPADSTSHNDTGLAVNTPYSYRVFARNSFGDSAHSNVASLTIVVSDSNDTDGDGVSDLFEYENYGHPTDNTDGTDDLDKDGVSDRVEIALGTDPDNAGNSPALSSTALAGHWPMDETSGGTAADASGNGNDAVWFGGAGTNVWVSGLIGNASQTNDENGGNGSEHYRIADLDTLDGATSVAISLWFNQNVDSNNNSTYNGLFMTRDLGSTIGAGAGENWGVALDGNNTPRNIDWRVNGAAGPETANIIGNTQDEWHHVLYVWNGTTGSAQLYQDGAPLHTMGTATGSIISGGEWRIGDDACCGSREFTGTLDDIAVFSGPLDAVDADLINQAGIAGISVSEILPGLDSDSDGLTDAFEQEHYGHPTANTDGTGDLDGDGQGDASEIFAGNNPEDPDSLLEIIPSGSSISGTPTGTSVTLEWSSITGRSYTIWKSSTLLPGSWTTVQSDIPAAGATISETFEVSGARWFFRIEVLP